MKFMSCVLAFLFGAEPQYHKYAEYSAGVKRREIDYKLKFERGIDFSGFSFARVASSWIQSDANAHVEFIAPLFLAWDVDERGTWLIRAACSIRGNQPELLSYATNLPIPVACDWSRLCLSSCDRPVSDVTVGWDFSPRPRRQVLNAPVSHRVATGGSGGRSSLSLTSI